MAPPGPRPPGPERVMPQAWGSDWKMRSALPSGKTDKPLGGGVKPPRDAGRGSQSNP
jgi:hypothetical protein